MRRSRAVQHVAMLAEACAELEARLRTVSTWRLTGLWAFGTVVEPPTEVPQDGMDHVRVAVVLDLPVAEVPWMVQPEGAEWFLDVTRASKNPVVCFWRSSQDPVWNHIIRRPVLVWDAGEGIREDALDALRTGDAESFRLPAPSPEELRARLESELPVSLAALRSATRRYDERRWGRGSVLVHADALWDASFGYLDLLDAIGDMDASSR